MQTKAKLRYLRMSPRKTRLVVDIIRGLEVQPALEHLKFSNRRAARPIIKLLNSAIANAEHNDNLKRDNLFIKEIKVDEGPPLKRWRARAFGRAAGIKKRTSHITLVLAEIKETEKQVGSDRKEESTKKTKKQENKNKDIKVVKSLDEVKEKEIETQKFDKVAKPAEAEKEAEHKPKPVDIARMGKDREKQHLDKIRRKDKGGALKRMFRRKSV